MLNAGLARTHLFARPVFNPLPAASSRHQHLFAAWPNPAYRACRLPPAAAAAPPRSPLDPVHLHPNRRLLRDPVGPLRSALVFGRRPPPPGPGAGVRVMIVVDNMAVVPVPPSPPRPRPSRQSPNPLLCGLPCRLSRRPRSHPVL